MQVEEAHIKACISGSCNAQKTVGVGLVISAEAADGVDVIHEFFYMAVVNAGILRVCNDVSSCLRTSNCL